MDHDIDALVVEHRDLFVSVGAVVVAAGQVEWALKRLLANIRGDGDLGRAIPARIAALMGAALDSEVRKDASATTDPLGAQILSELDWADSHHLTDFRNNVAHTAWGMDVSEQAPMQAGVAGGRHMRDGAYGTTVTTTATLREGAARLFEFVDRIDVLTPEPRWVNAWGPIPYWLDASQLTQGGNVQSSPLAGLSRTPLPRTRP